MRGPQVIILLGAVLLLAIIAIVVLTMGGGDDKESGTPEAIPQDNNQVNVGSNNTDGGGTGAVVNSGPTPTLQEVSQIVVAEQTIHRGDIITDEMIRLEYWPIISGDEWNYYFEEDASLVVGQIARVDIFRGSPITNEAVIDTYVDLAQAGGSEAAAIIPQGMVAVSIPLDPSGLGQAAFAIQDGDYVDVYFSFLFVNVDEEFQTRVPNTFSIITRLESGELSIGAPRQGRQETSTLSLDGVLVGPSEPAQRPRLLTQQMVTAAYVVHVGYFPEDGRFLGATPTQLGMDLPPTAYPGDATPGQQQEAPTMYISPTPWEPVIMTVAVRPQDAVMLTWAIDAQIPINLALRPVNDDSLLPAQAAVSLTYLMTGPGEPSYNPGDPNNPHPVVADPGTKAISLEPPITSIRRFDVASLYDFVQAELNAAEGQ